MKITLTNIALLSVPDINQVIHLFWKKEGETDGAYRTLPDATVNPSGVILSPSPYQFNTEGTLDTNIVVKAVNDCDDSFTIIEIFPGLELCCPDGYALSEDETYCFKSITTEATPPSDPQNTVEKNLVIYSEFGTLIYDSGFNVDGTGTFTQIPYTNPFWVNGPGYPTSGGGNLIDGPLNRAGLWAPMEASGQTVGFTVCVALEEQSIYYIGCAADNWITIKVDGSVVVDMDRVAMAAFLSANGYPSPGLGCTFQFWHIYPILLNAGNRVLEIVGNNEVAPLPNPAAMGVEIYRSNKAELELATSYTDLGADLIFSSKDYIGQPIQVGSDGFGYTCPEDYSLVLCAGPAYCTKITTIPVQGC
jgi:hypothetical protein